jgi:hypothetical protein
MNLLIPLIHIRFKINLNTLYHLLTKIAGDHIYENNPLIVSFDIEVANYHYNNNALLVTILFFVAFSIIIVIIFVPNFRKQISGFFERVFIKK